MNMPHNHTIHSHQCHFGWDNANKPVVMAPGETVEFHPVDSSGGQLTASSTVADIAKLDFGKVNPVAGPVYIDGAEPGDAIKVTLLDFTPSGWGWTANIPGFGLLADTFKEPALHIWKYDTFAMTPAAYGPGGRVPLKPFCGTIGLAPAEPGTHSIVPPRRDGRQHGHPRHGGGHRALSAGRGEGRPLLRRRHARDARRRRGLRHGDREPVLGGGALRARQRCEPEIPALHDARPRRAAIWTTRATRRRPASAPI